MSIETPCRGPLFIVANAAAGGASEEAMERVERFLRESDRPYRILRSRGDLPRVARLAAAMARHHRGAVVAAGGDGTVNAVAKEALEAQRPFGVLPLGTFNYFARAHDLPSDPEQAAAVWLDGRVEPVQVGTVNGHAFLVNASLGLHPRVLKEREGASARFGRHRWVALASALKTLLSWRSVMRIVIASERRMRQLWTPSLFIGNNPLQLAPLGLDGVTTVGRGHLAAVCVAPLSAWRLLALAARAAFGRRPPVHEVTSELFRTMTVVPAGGNPVEVACDGEVRHLRSPLHFNALPHALKLLKRP